MNPPLARVARLPGLAFRAGQVGVVLSCRSVPIGAGALAARLRPGPAPTGSGARWAGLLAALGPSFIKIGQLLSTRRDLLPEQVCGALGRLTDSAPPPRRAKLERAVRRAYADRPWPFAQFDWTPVACGSIATVHRAVTRDGRLVAVKVRRPGISRVMQRDFELTSAMMSLLGTLPRLRRMPFKLMHDQVGGAILRQLDFTAELASLTALRENLADFEGVRIPAPVPELSTEETVVMEFITDLTRFEPGELTQATRTDVVRRTLGAVYEMLFVDGLVHCDLHPGNLYFDREARLIMLDAGFVVRLPDGVRASFADFFINMATGDGRMCAQIVIDSAATLPDSGHLNAFRTDLTALVESVSGARSKNFNLAVFAGRLFDLQRKHGLFPAPEFAFPLLSLLVVEGMIKDFDSEMDFQAEALPVLRRRNTVRAEAG